MSDLNPFDLSGPDFLGLWYSLAMFVWLGVLLAKHLVARRHSHRAVRDIAEELHPTEIAYLDHGIERATCL